MSALISGLAVAFYFSWQISLVCCAMVPFMAGAFGVMVSSGVGDDGVTGKAAFEGAANVAAETLSVMRTVASFGGEGSEPARSVFVASPPLLFQQI